MALSGFDEQEKKFAHYRKDFLVPTVESLNKNPSVEFRTSFEEYKEGKSVTEVVFSIEKKEDPDRNKMEAFLSM